MFTKLEFHLLGGIELLKGVECFLCHANDHCEFWLCARTQLALEGKRAIGGEWHLFESMWGMWCLSWLSPDVQKIYEAFLLDR